MILDLNELKKTWIYFSLFCLECLTFDKTSLASTLKQPDVTCVHTKYGKNDKKTIDQSSYHFLCTRFLKSICMTRFMLSLIVFFLRSSAALELILG